MIEIPASQNSQFNALLDTNRIPKRYQDHYLKWLRYYLDFRHKYGFSESNPQYPWGLPLIRWSAGPRRERHWRTERRFWTTRGTSRWPRWRFPGEWETICFACDTLNPGRTRRTLPTESRCRHLWLCTTWRTLWVSEYPWGSFPIFLNPTVTSLAGRFGSDCRLTINKLGKLRRLPSGQSPVKCMWD